MSNINGYRIIFLLTFGLSLFSCIPFLFPEDDAGSVMVKINAKGKSFDMGYEDGDSTQTPVHRVDFSYNFFIGKTEVTQAQYEATMSEYYENFIPPEWSERYGKGDKYPAYYVNWYDAVLYCNALSHQNGLDTVYKYDDIVGYVGNHCFLKELEIKFSKNGYRLPTEAEWEYACRGGVTAKTFWKKDDIQNFAWFFDNSESSTHPVGKLKSNGFGLFDVNGNVWEWTQDWYQPYKDKKQTDPTGPSEGSYKTVRGGGWYDSEEQQTSASRWGVVTPITVNNMIGFRVVQPL